MWLHSGPTAFSELPQRPSLPTGDNFLHHKATKRRVSTALLVTDSVLDSPHLIRWKDMRKVFPRPRTSFLLCVFVWEHEIFSQELTHVITRRRDEKSLAIPKCNSSLSNLKKCIKGRIQLNSRVYGRVDKHSSFHPTDIWWFLRGPAVTICHLIHRKL